MENKGERGKICRAEWKQINVRSCEKKTEKMWKINYREEE